MDSCRATEDAGRYHTLIAQAVFLLTGIFSTCAAQFVYYQGAGAQRAMLLPLSNYMGMMLVGLIPTFSPAQSTAKKKTPTHKKEDEDPEQHIPAVKEIPTAISVVDPGSISNITRRPNTVDPSENPEDELLESSSSPSAKSPNSKIAFGSETSFCSLKNISPEHWIHVGVALNVLLDFSGCIFANIGLTMAGSGVFQVVYSSVVCWSAIMSRIVLKRRVSRDQWRGIALVTFGLAFSAMGESNHGKDSSVIVIGSLNTLMGAAFYGATYVAGEYMLKLPHRPQPRELCVKIGSSCVSIIAVYMIFFVVPYWDELITAPVQAAGGSTTSILIAILAYTISQLAHGLTYFMVLSSSGAVTAGIMQSLRAVGVFVLSSMLFCSQQESQCFDTKRGIATMIVVCGVMFYSWAKGNASKTKSAFSSLSAAGAADPSKEKRSIRSLQPLKSYIV